MIHLACGVMLRRLNRLCLFDIFEVALNAEEGGGLSESSPPPPLPHSMILVIDYCSATNMLLIYASVDLLTR